MAHNLKLDIFRISLKKKGSSNDKLFDFKDFFAAAFSIDDKEKAYTQFVKKFISIFENEFKMNADNTKAISASDQHSFTIRSNNNIIDGEIIGGPTGIDQKLYLRKNSKKEEGKITNDNVTVLPYYIKLWTPLDHNTGILMVQSYSNHTVTEMVKVYISRMFQDYNYSIVITPHIPNAVKEEYRHNSSVYKVAFVKESLSKDKRKLMNPLFTEFAGLKIRIEVSGFSEKVEDFWSKFTGNNKILNSNLEDFDIKENDDFKTIAYYKDDKGHKSNTTIKKQIEIRPTVFLDSKLKKAGSEHYDFVKIKEHTDSILNNIKTEIGYVSSKS